MVMLVRLSFLLDAPGWSVGVNVVGFTMTVCLSPDLVRFLLGLFQFMSLC